MSSESETFSKGEFFRLLLLFFVSFGVRFLHIHISPIISTDGVLYIEQAKSIFKGDGYLHLYPILIRLFYFIFDDWEVASRFVSVFFGTFAIFPFYLLIKFIFDRELAFCAASFFAITPHVVEYSSDALREPILWFFLFSALLFAQYAFVKMSSYYLVFSVVFSLFASLTRLEGILSVFLVTFWGIYLAIKNGEKRKKLLLFTFLYLFFFTFISFFGLYSIWSIIGSQRLPQLLLLAKNMNTHSLNPLLKEIENLKVSPRLYLFFEIAYRFRHFSFFLEILYKSAKSIGPVFTFLFVMGVILKKCDLGKNKFFFLMWLTLCLAFSYVLVLKRHYFLTRYGLIIGIPAFVWVAKGFYEISFILEGFAKKISFLSPFRNSIRTLVFLLVIFCVLPSSLKPYRIDKIELKHAGLYLKQNGFSGKKIAASPKYSRVLFYADAIPFYLLELEYTKIKEEMEKNGVEYLLLDSDQAKTLFSKGFDITSTFEKITIPEFAKLKAYSLHLYRIAP